MELIYMHIVDVGRSIKAQGINFSNDFSVTFMDGELYIKKKRVMFHAICMVII